MLTLFAIKPIVLLALSDAMLTLATLRSRLTHINVTYAQSWSTVLRCGTSHTLLVPPGSWELVQRRAALYTLGRYLLTSSVDAMLIQLEWEPLAARCHTARLVMFYTRSSADADNRLDAFSGQSRSTSMVPFHMLHIVSYCAIVTLSLRRRVVFYDIRLQKIS